MAQMGWIRKKNKKQNGVCQRRQGRKYLISFTIKLSCGMFRNDKESHWTECARTRTAISADIRVGVQFLKAFQPSDHGQEKAEPVIRFGVNLFDFG